MQQLEQQEKQQQQRIERAAKKADSSTKQHSTGLALPDEIEAADAEDLASALLLANTAKIDERQSRLWREQKVRDETGEIRGRYEAKAREVYEELFTRCGDQYPGHSYTNHDAGKATIRVCQTCGHNAPSGMENESRVLAEQATTAAVRALAKRMIALDEEAGVLVWPKPDDYLSDAPPRMHTAHEGEPRWLSYAKKHKLGLW